MFAYNSERKPLSELKPLKFLQMMFGVFAVFYLLKLMEYNEVVVAIRNMELRYLFLCGMLSMSHLLLSSLRWYIFLLPNQQRRLRYLQIIKANLKGYSIMFSMPFGATGHLIKPKLIPGDYKDNLFSLILSQTMEINALLAVFLFWKFGMKGLILPVAACVAILLLRKMRETTFLVKLFNGFIERVRIPHDKVLVSGFILGVMTLLVQAAGIIFAFRATGLDVGMSNAILAVVLCHVFGALSPFPAGIAVGEMGIVLATGQETHAVIAAFIYRFIFQYVYSALGSLLFIREGVKKGVRT